MSVRQRTIWDDQLSPVVLDRTLAQKSISQLDVSLSRLGLACRSATKH